MSPVRLPKSILVLTVLFSAPLLTTIMLAQKAGAAVTTRPFYAGADISMLPEIEKAGGIFRRDGQPADAVQLLRDHGVNLFRLRLFVDPDLEFRKTGGATQNLEAVKTLARRVRAAGGMILLDLHYSDTWADPEHQATPRAWADLDFESLDRKVFDYTSTVLSELRANGTPPEMVQVGNEITTGMLWPVGSLLKVPPDQTDRQWKQFRALVRSGIRAVRASETETYRPSIAIHIHGGGKPGLPKWFFNRFSPKADPIDFDVIGLSYYPAWGDSLDALKRNLDELCRDWKQDILVAETSYPWKQMQGLKDKSAMNWPQTINGQLQFTQELTAAVRALPDGRGIGSVWWYPEAIQVPTKTYRIWRGGAEALFDESGTILPATDALSPSTRPAP